MLSLYTNFNLKTVIFHITVLLFVLTPQFLNATIITGRFIDCKTGNGLIAATWTGSNSVIGSTDLYGNFIFDGYAGYVITILVSGDFHPTYTVTQEDVRNGSFTHCINLPPPTPPPTQPPTQPPPPQVEKAKSLAVGKNADGRQEVFYIGTDNAIWHKWQVVQNGGWSEKRQLDPAAKSLAVGKNADGRQEVFYIGTDNAIWHRWQLTPNGFWSGADQLDPAAKSLAVEENADGRQEVFYIGTDDAIWHRWQLKPSGSWSGADQLAPAAKSLAVGKNADGRLVIFYIGTDNVIWYRSQMQDNSWWYAIKF
jgi:hypothetical protein